MRKLIVAVIIMFIGTNAFSQGIDIDLGVKGGANFSNIRDLPSLGLQYKIGFHAGVFVGIKFSEKIGIQAEALYSQLGAEFRTNGNFDLNYVSIPILLKYYLVKGEKFNIQIGPQFSILIDDNLRASYNGFEQRIEGNDNDIAGVIGFGYDFPYGFHVDGRYHIGFTDVTDYPGARGQHKYISIGIGYTFF